MSEDQKPRLDNVTTVWAGLDTSNLNDREIAALNCTPAVPPIDWCADEAEYQRQVAAYCPST